MYKISVPVMLGEAFDAPGTLAELMRAGAQRVFLAIPTLSFQKEKREAIIAMLEENIPYFKKNGLETGVWLWTFLRTNQEHDERGCVRQMDQDGNLIPGGYCPFSPGFVADASDFMERVSAFHPDVIQFDDDFRLPTSNEISVGCFCDLHMKRYCEILGENITREELYQKAFGGGANRYREAIYRGCGESMESFAQAMRRATDAVDDSIRLSFCSCMPSWDYNGTDGIRMAKAMAGKTQPLLRLTAAPYWAGLRAWGTRLAYTMEMTRMESAWCDGTGIETMSEGDVYPRPRSRVSASYLEIYDTALRFAGETDGMLKYMMDYFSSPRYETGYIDRHVKNQKLYEEITALTVNQESRGVRVYETMHKYLDTDMKRIPNPHKYAWDSFFSHAARLLADNSVPTTYRGSGVCGIAFGENARALPKEALDHGLILDIRAAEILTQQGVDVGLAAIGPACKSELLHFAEEDERVLAGYGFGHAYDITPKAGAEVLVYNQTRTTPDSELDWDGSAANKDTQTEYPDTYRYENASGQRFLVFSFDALYTDDLRWRNYTTQRLLVKQIPWLGKKPLPAVCTGNPDLYVQAKGNDSCLTVGLWNAFADEILSPTVELDSDYRSITFLNCKGKLQGNRVVLEDMPAYTYAFFRVEK